MSSPLENEVHLPLVDISQISLDFEGKQFQSDPVLATVREACEEWGFFCVVNHGIPPDFFQNVESLVRQLCTMSTEAKQKAATSNPTMSYSRTDYMDNFCFPELPHSSSVQEMCERIWAEDGNPEFCETIQKYILYVADLATKIAKMLIASLGLDVDAFYHSDFENWKSHLRINNYYPCDGRMSMEEEFPSAHTDIGLFTILYQVNEGGLQIRSKEGKWLNVMPLPHSFVINVADCFKAWSNGRYRSAEHRVVYKGWENRISLPYFVQFPPDKQILAPEELVDDDHPRRYRPFTFSHFKTEFYKDLDPKVKQPAIFIDTYAGI